MAMPRSEHMAEPTYDAYAEKWDDVAATVEDADAIYEAARTLRTAMDSIPGWVIEHFGLTEVVERMDYVTVQEWIASLDEPEYRNG